MTPKVRNGESAPEPPPGPELPGRTLAVFHLAETSGPSRSLENELRWLSEHGSVDVVAPGPGAVLELFSQFAEPHVLAYEALTLPRDPVAAARSAQRVRRETRAFRALIAERRPELVVVGSAMLPSATIAARRVGIPVAVYAGELFPGAGVRGAGGRGPATAAKALGGRARGRGPATAAKALGGRALARMTGRLADAVMACSQTVADQYRGASRAAVSVLYPPIPDLSGADGAAFRSELGVAEDDALLVAVGNVTENRGQDVLVRALPAIRAALPGARVAIVGEPHPRSRDLEYRDRLASLAAELGVADAVSFAGHRDDVSGVLAGADVVVNPRLVGEAFGRVACEALSAGTPVVAMREGAVPEVLRDEETALLVQPGDSAAIATAALRLLRDPGLAERLVAAGRRDVLRRFSPERSLAEFRRVATELAGAPPASRR
jgi:glycosyltransferase involved in cell wall biosynthesis